MRKKLTPNNLNKYQFRDFDDYLRVQDAKNGIIRLTGVITDELANYVLVEIETIYRLGLKTITLHINSPGGDVYSALSIYDALRAFSNGGGKINAIVNGLAASAAAEIVLQAADNRSALPSSSFLLHEISGWSAGYEKVSEIKDKAKEMERLTDLCSNILAKRCGITKDEAIKVVERKEYWMGTEEALKFGLIDEILK